MPVAYAICRELTLTEGKPPPEWIELLPRGPQIKGRDGREWKLSDPRRVIAAFNAAHVDLVIDVEHASEIKAEAGEPAPAVGWISELTVGDSGALLGKVAWNAEGTQLVGGRKYRYYSPAFDYEKASGEIARMRSVGLTNRPNLELPALNRQDDASQGGNTSAGNPNMTLISKTLGLEDTATEGDVLTAINQLQTRAQTPPLDKFVPRADYDTALNRATALETQLRQVTEKAKNEEIEALIKQGLEKGSVTPATAEYHRAQCRQEGGLERFKEFVAKAPVIAGASGLDGKRPDAPAGDGLDLTEAERAMCRNMGLDPKVYAKSEFRRKPTQ